MEKTLKEIISNLKKDLEKIKSEHDFLNIKSAYLGKKSKIASLLGKLSTFLKEEKPSLGKKLNLAKNEILNLLNEKEKELKEHFQKKRISDIDLSMPGKRDFKGAIHPLSIVMREIEDIFMSMGFDISSYYEIEDDFHNFDALNTPENHSSRNLADTFYTITGKLLRTQTSTEQIRIMENFKPPIKIISIGRCYRNDKSDASHSPFFHQVEALVVDKNIRFTDLRDTLQIFVEKMFGVGTKSRFRPHFFPFTEPSGEIDISCVKCLGKGCNVCKGSVGWKWAVAAW